MTQSIKEILAPLDGHWDRILRRPMSRKEVRDLERQVGLSAPALLRDYLLQIGLFQDLTVYGASSIEVYESIEDFVSAREFLARQLPPKHASLFPFGGDGAGNAYCLPTADEHCCIHFFDHETGKVSKGKDFADWLRSVVLKVLRGIRRRLPNERKVWAVQFSFSGTDYKKLARLLASVGVFKEVDSRWMDATTTEAGVTSKERRIKLDGQPLTVVCLEHADWDAPMISFDMSEPIAKGLEQSRVRMLDDLFNEKCPDYDLVDYGPIDSLELES
jgi:hypothetical protein